MSNRAWVTLATNDSYGLGALVLAHSLRRVGSAYPAVILITPAVTDAMRDRLRAVFAEVITVDVLDSQDAAHLALLQRPELGITFTKIHCWNLTQFDRCVFLDADILVVQNCDELFEREELSAAPDVGWPDCFNSGVFVFHPSADTFSRLVTFAQERGSFDGGDQGLLNSFFSSWSVDSNKRLPFLYNVTSAAFYSYLPALKHYGQNLKIIHFIGTAKPWLQHYNFESQSVDAPDHLKGFLQLWWDLFTSQVHPQLDESMTGVAGNLARVHLGSPLQREAIDELTRRQGWESGNIDYMGADSFANIWAKISQTLSGGPSSPPKQPSPPKEPAQASGVQAKEAAVELADKVAAVSISETPDIPVPAAEAATAAGKTSDSSSSISVPQLASEAPITEADVKTECSTAPNDTVAAAEVCQSPDTISSEVPKEEITLEPTEPVAAETVATPVSDQALHESQPLEPTSSETKEVHEVGETHENDVPQIDSISEKPVDVHAAVPISESPIEPSKAESVEAVPVKSPEASIDAPQGESAPAPEVHESKPAEVPSEAPKVESEAPPAVSEAVPASEIVSPPAVPESKPESENASIPSVPESVPAPEVAPVPVVPESVPVSEAVPPVVPESAAAPEAESIPSVVHEPKPASEIVKDAPAVEAAPIVPVEASPQVESPPSVPEVDPPKSDVAPVDPKPESVSAPSEPKQDKAPEKLDAPASDSPPLANTPSQEEIPSVTAAKSEERRKPAAKLQLKPPAVADPLPTPDSELEDAASLAQSIIASELRTPTVTSPSPTAGLASPQLQAQPQRLDVRKPDVPTPPVGAVSLSQIGVKPKAKPTTASQIESSVSDKPDTEAPKKKVVKKVVKKDGASSGEAPVPPPRKKEKKPKDK